MLPCETLDSLPASQHRNNRLALRGLHILQLRESSLAIYSQHFYMEASSQTSGTTRNTSGQDALRLGACKAGNINDEGYTNVKE